MPPEGPDPAHASMEEIVAAQLFVLRAVYGAFINASVLYAGVLWFVIQDRPPAEGQGLLLVALSVAGVAVSLASFLIRPVLHSPRRIGKAWREGGDARALRSVVGGYIVTWAVADTCAVVGLVLGILTAHPFAYVLIVLGAALIIAHPASQQRVADILGAAERELTRTGGL